MSIARLRTLLPPLWSLLTHQGSAPSGLKIFAKTQQYVFTRSKNDEPNSSYWCVQIPSERNTAKKKKNEITQHSNLIRFYPSGVVVTTFLPERKHLSVAIKKSYLEFLKLKEVLCDTLIYNTVYIKADWILCSYVGHARRVCVGI